MQCSLHYSIFDIPWWQQGQLYSEKVDMNEDEPEIVYIDCENETFDSQWWVRVQLYTQKTYLSALLIYSHPAGKKLRSLWSERSIFPACQLEQINKAGKRVLPDTQPHIKIIQSQHHVQFVLETHINACFYLFCF